MWALQSFLSSVREECRGDEPRKGALPPSASLISWLQHRFQHSLTRYIACTYCTLSTPLFPRFPNRTSSSAGSRPLPHQRSHLFLLLVTRSLCNMHRRPPPRSLFSLANSPPPSQHLPTKLHQPTTFSPLLRPRRPHLSSTRRPVSRRGTGRSRRTCQSMIPRTRRRVGRGGRRSRRWRDRWLR